MKRRNMLLVEKSWFFYSWDPMEILQFQYDLKFKVNHSEIFCYTLWIQINSFLMMIHTINPCLRTGIYQNILRSFIGQSINWFLLFEKWHFDSCSIPLDKKKVENIFDYTPYKTLNIDYEYDAKIASLK